MCSGHILTIAQANKMDDEEPSQEEIIAAIAEATNGASLLKLSKKASSHFRQFHLTMDLSSLIWDSPRKEKPGVMISEITGIALGQTTPVFKKNPNPVLESLSFSLLYSGRSLDLICKDKREYKVWTTALKALINGFRDADAISKHISSQGKKTKPGDRVAVVVGTLTAKVQVKENASDLYTWGNGDYGVLGHRESDKEALPRVVEALLGRDIVQFALGSKHMMAISANGAVFSWGSGQYGRLGQGHLRDRYAPLMISDPLRSVKVTQVACNEFHSAVVCENGDLYTWGKAGPHLGYLLENTKQLRPRKVDAMVYGRVQTVACGNQHTVVIVSDQKVYAFGQNDRGQLGLGNHTPTDIPTPVCGLDEFVPLKVSCGKFHTALHTGDRQVATWGANDKGQLGLTDTNDRVTPTLVTFSGSFSGEHHISDVSCGDNHTVVLTANSIVFSWGDNEFQQLGLNKPKKFSSIPVAVVTPTGCQVQSVACGGTFTAALTHTSVLYTWGCNSSGQLGHGDYKQRVTPTAVDSLAGKRLRSIQCGGQHMACAIMHTWVPDEEAKGCMACKKQFTTFYRRHHCRNCGGIFCGNCSTKRFPLLHLGMSEPVRVCDKCYIILSADHS